MFDNTIKPDVRAVLNACALLEISEYEFFRLAYLRWQHKMPDERAMERQFAAYMFQDIVPAWVRNFANLVEQQHDQGTLERSALGISDPPQSSAMRYRGLLVIIAILAVMSVLIGLAESAAPFMSADERCVFPPCY